MEILKQYDGPAPQAKAVAAPLQSAVWNGFHTLTCPDGSHRTFRVRTEKNGVFVGKRTVALLIGPDNTTDYETLGFLLPFGPVIWKRHRGGKSEGHVRILWDVLSGQAIDGYEVKSSKRCAICNRMLTTPESYERGYGPDCWAKVVGK